MRFDRLIISADDEAFRLGVVSRRGRAGLIWECAACGQNDDQGLGWAHAVSLLLDHVATEHPAYLDG